MSKIGWNRYIAPEKIDETKVPELGRAPWIVPTFKTTGDLELGQTPTDLPWLSNVQRVDELTVQVLEMVSNFRCKSGG